MKNLSLYVHIPFCKRKCFYCDFPSFANQEENWERYLQMLCVEMVEKGKGLQEYTIQTVFIGGGTPTLFSAKQLEKLLDVLFQNFSVAKEAEITIEANPGTLSLEKLQGLRKSGVNRLSMGVQAWQDRLLKTLGRIHTREDFLRNLEAARKVGFTNINADLMFSLPGQTLQDWEETLQNVTALSLEHLSAYSLIVEEGTPFFEWHQKGTLSLPEEEIDRKMYALARSFLEDFGYHQYEISNFAQKGKESRHNIIYWQEKEYLGLGLGAHSFLNKRRFHNAYSMETYCKTAGKWEAIEEIEEITIDIEQSEFMFMGLRMTQGIAETQFQQRFGSSLERIYGKEIQECITQGLLERKNGFIRLTSRGMDVANLVFEKFLK